MFLYGGSDIDDQINRLFDTPHIASVKGGCINEEDEDSGEDDLIKDIENDFNSVEQTREFIGSILAKIKNLINTPINKEKLVKKLESHPRPETLKTLLQKLRNYSKKKLLSVAQDNIMSSLQVFSPRIKKMEVKE